jgi:hypothetical protein
VGQYQCKSLWWRAKCVIGDTVKRPKNVGFL